MNTYADEILECENCHVAAVRRVYHGHAPYIDGAKAGAKFSPYFDEGLGREVKSMRHRKEIMRAENLVELGNETPPPGKRIQREVDLGAAVEAAKRCGNEIDSYDIETIRQGIELGKEWRRKRKINPPKGKWTNPPKKLAPIKVGFEGPGLPR